MLYFGGAGVKGQLHPSLKAYINCFSSPPFPKMFPRGGGIWDQDPILMRDFRVIRKFEVEYKQIEDASSSAKGGGLGLQDAMKQYLDELGEDGTF